jgi:sugar lactone lactonase YvrE
MLISSCRQVLCLALPCLSFGVLSVHAAERHDLQEICGDCQVERFAACGGFLEGATVDRSGALWAVDLLSGNVLRVDDRGQCHVEATTGGAPNGAKFHRDGRLFIADKNLGILAFDPGAGTLATIADTYRAERIRGTNDLVFDADGGLYFTEPYGSSALDADGRVFYLPPGENAALAVAADGLAFPNGIALSADGNNLYVGEYANKRVLSIPSVRSTNAFDVPHVVAYTEGGVGPDGIALDVDGNLYAAIFQGGEVRVIGADRFAYGSIVLPEGAGTFVTNIAFNGDFLYITEASQGVIWRVRVARRGLPFFHQR